MVLNVKLYLKIIIKCFYFISNTIDEFYHDNIFSSFEGQKLINNLKHLKNFLITTLDLTSIDDFALLTFYQHSIITSETCGQRIHG